MFTDEIIKRLLFIYQGAGIHNDVLFTRDWKRLYVFHTSNVCLRDQLRDGLFVTFSIAAAIRQWNSCYTRRGYQTYVNVFTIPIDYDCWFTPGDCFERHNGGAGYIRDVSCLEFIGHVSKTELEQFMISKEPISIFNQIKPAKLSLYIPHEFHNTLPLLDAMQLYYYRRNSNLLPANLYNIEYYMKPKPAVLVDDFVKLFNQLALAFGLYTKFPNIKCYVYALDLELGHKCIYVLKDNMHAEEYLKSFYNVFDVYTLEHSLTTFIEIRKET